MLLNFRKTLYHKIFVCWPYTALQPAVRPTSHRRMSPIFSHNAGDSCLITDVLF